MMPSTPDKSDKAPHLSRSARYSEWMTVREMLAELERLPRDAELLAFEAGCEDNCEREVDEVEWQGYTLAFRSTGRSDGRRSQTLRNLAQDLLIKDGGLTDDNVHLVH
jgi:hypothetical protein